MTSEGLGVIIITNGPVDIADNLAIAIQGTVCLVMAFVTCISKRVTLEGDTFGSFEQVGIDVVGVFFGDIGDESVEFGHVL